MSMLYIGVVEGIERKYSAEKKMLRMSYMLSEIHDNQFLTEYNKTAVVFLPSCYILHCIAPQYLSI